MKDLLQKVDECKMFMYDECPNMTMDEVDGVIGSMTYKQMLEFHANVVYCKRVGECPDDMHELMDRYAEILTMDMRVDEPIRCVNGHLHATVEEADTCDAKEVANMVAYKQAGGVDRETTLPKWQPATLIADKWVCVDGHEHSSQQRADMCRDVRFHGVTLEEVDEFTKEVDRESLR